MNSVLGIAFEQDRETQRRYLRVDLEQHGEKITPFLETIGVISHDDDFEKSWASALTSDEFKQLMY
jgi:hypothetical protein